MSKVGGENLSLKLLFVNNNNLGFGLVKCDDVLVAGILYSSRMTLRME